MERPSNDAIRFWIEMQLRDALDNEEHIMSAMAMFKVAHQAGDQPRDIFRKVLANFVYDALGIEPPKEKPEPPKEGPETPKEGG